MTRDEAVSIIQNRLGQRTGLSSQITTELQLKQTELERSPHLPWFLTKESSGLATVASTRTVALPSDFLREQPDSNSLGSIWITTTEDGDVQLIKDSYDILKGSTWLEDSGRPTHYAVMGLYIYLFPLPDAIYPLTMHYYAAETVLTTSGSTNKWLSYAPDLLIAETGVTIAKFLRDQAAIQLFADDLARARARSLGESVAREQASMSAVMGG